MIHLIGNAVWSTFEAKLLTDISRLPPFRFVVIIGQIDLDCDLFQWEVMPDLFFYRDPEEAEKEEKERWEKILE